MSLRTAADLLYEAIGNPVLGAKTPPAGVEPLETPANCAISGKLITYGYRCRDIAPAALNDFLGTFNGQHDGWLSVEAAGVMLNDWNLGSRLVTAEEDGQVEHHHVLVSKTQAATQNRRYWSELVRSIWPAYRDRECVAIIATDPKKRVWHRARAGRLGAATPLFLHAPDWNASHQIQVDWEQFIETLDIIETVFATCSMKGTAIDRNAIRTSLLSIYRLIIDIGAPRLRELEEQLQPVRQRPEFLPALIIAQA